MILRQFLQENQITGFEIIENQLIINVVTNETLYGLSVDTSNIQSGTPVTFTADYIINDNMIEIDELSINIDETIISIE